MGVGLGSASRSVMAAQLSVSSTYTGQVSISNELIGRLHAPYASPLGAAWTPVYGSSPWFQVSTI